MRRSPFCRPSAAALRVWLLVTILLSTASLAFAARYQQGERVQLTGVVSDRAGRPLENVRVVLEAKRSYFSVRTFRREDGEVRRLSAVTNAKGEYSMEWPWDTYFNRFEMLAGVPVRKARVDRLEVLAREDVTQRILGGSPVVVSLVIENSRFVDTLREFMASVRSDDERRIYEEMGKPDKVERLNYPDHAEASWWYFESGRVYRFRDGRLDQVVPFTPVPGAAPAGAPSGAL